MQSPNDTGSKNKKYSKRLRSSPQEMPSTETNTSNALDDCLIFPVEEIVQYPLPGYGIPSAISFSPDDSLVAYLFSPDQTLSRKLFLFDTKSGNHELFFSPPDGGGLDEDNLSAEEKLRRERLRERGLGVTRYEWVKSSSKRKRVMVPLPTGIYTQDIGDKPQLRLPCESDSPIIDPHVSPDGTMLGYVRDNELHVLNFLYNTSKQLTEGANQTTITHGLAEFIAQEEMDRKNGYWWSLDSKYIAFTEVDSSNLPFYRIMHQGKSSVGADAEEDHAYPFAGCLNVKVRLGVVPSSGGPVSWMDLVCGGEDSSDEEYLARVNWMHSNILTAQVLNRTHSILKIIKFDIKTGQRTVILEEENEIWVNLHDCFTPLDKLPNRPSSSGGFIWASEKTGFRHLYLHDIDGSCVGPITRGEWMVEQVAGVNEASGLVYFVGTLDSPLESHLYCADLFPAGPSLRAPVRLTIGKGKHAVVLDHQLRRFVDVYDCLESPPKITVRSLLDGGSIVSLYEQPADIGRFRKLPLEPPEIVQFEAADGTTTLYGALYKPDASRFGPPPYKTMVHVYGGPSVQLVCDSWVNTVDMRAQYLRSKGILVWKMDNRGTARRGLEFAGALKFKCGHVDADDQLAGAEWLVSRGLSMPAHIGIYGWSYGGYLSAMALARFPSVFRCAVSGAPVTSWDGYDSFYTEKYMGLPLENRPAYERSSVMHHVGNLEGKLLLVHGMIDENVHFRHTARLVNALVSAGKFYELLIFPDERHMPRRQRDRVYMEERIWDFIDRCL
ncbi:prolyl oligopeptidase family protein [Striga hermonthica]|uniref:Prolyl oligopeptidase family protein n=1 Tax=Striga hermonthica TaxID=68872 RepID=A0A9N7MKR9_STRHE|nr:prolyl oligopeptidase family protein [Striga hermonthica]